MFTPGPILGEFFGTLVLVVFGDGNVANLVLKDSKANGSNWVHICWGWAWAVGLGVFAANALGSAQGDLNPVVTVAKTLAGTYGSWGEACNIIIAQMAGGFCGAVVVWLAYLSHWKGSDPSAQLGVFCTAPNKSEADRNLFHCFLTEAIATFFLVTLIMCVFSKGVAGAGFTPGLGTFFVVGIIYGLGAALGGPTGYALNPARDLSPRIAHFVLPIPGKRDSDWAYSWVPVVGPLVGAVVAYYFCHCVGIM